MTAIVFLDYQQCYGKIHQIIPEAGIFYTMTRIEKFTISSISMVFLGAALLTAPRQTASPEDVVSFPLYPLEVEASETAEKVVRGETPNKLRISSIAVDAAVREANVERNDWGFFEDAVSFWNGSARPGEGGNVVLYAHRKSLFGLLSQVKIGDSVIVGTQSGSFRYTISSFRVVSPEQLEVFAPTEEEQLTLLTCTNPDDADRLVIIAHPSSSFGELL